MKTEKYNPIKTIRVYCAVQGRNTLADVTLYKWGDEDNRRWMNAYAVFSSKKKAKEWVAHWRNAGDFTIVETKIEIPEFN